MTSRAIPAGCAMAASKVKQRPPCRTPSDHAWIQVTA
jgi:hypothetical protein